MKHFFNKNLIAVAAVFLFAELFFTVPSYADQARAEYLERGMSSSVTDYTHLRALTDTLVNTACCEISPVEYHDFIYSVDYASSFEFIRAAADERELIYAGTFLNTSDTAEQFSFLKNVNLFRNIDSSLLYLTGGNRESLYAGDILFFLDDSGFPVAAGFVCSVHSLYYSVAVNNPQEGTAIIRLDSESVQPICNFTVIRPIYSSNEQQIWLFCRDEMGYTKSGSCGILANVYRESDFRTGIEEEEYKEGIGICQWSFERHTGFISWCRKNNLDSMRLRSQLEYLKYELENDFSFTGDLLKSIQENETGAYDAGYWICFEYEMPDEFEFVSDDRAVCSRDSFWPIYKNLS